MRAIKAQHPLDSAGGTWPSRRLDPRIACRDRELRITLLLGLSAWRGTYREAWERWRHGERGVSFPAGTYWMRVTYRVKCERRPAAMLGVESGPSPPTVAA